MMKVEYIYKIGMEPIEERAFDTWKAYLAVEKLAKELQEKNPEVSFYVQGEERFVCDGDGT